MSKSTAICVTVLALLLASCAQEVVPNSTEDVPPDFSVEFSVHADTESSGQVDLAARYLLLPNRQFRTLEGRKAIDQTYPSLLRTVTPREFADVYQYIADNELDGRPHTKVKTAPDAWPTTQTSEIYLVKITANGRTKRYVIPKYSSPEIDGLLKVLLDLEKQ
jgi:hypothetical protein